MDERTVDGVRWSVDANGLGRIVLDRPAQSNTLTSAVSNALALAINEIAESKTRAVLLTGTGKVFCAGGDIDEFRADLENLPKLVFTMLSVLHPVIVRLAELPVPVVTAINGSIGGAGVGLALCGDFALASSTMKMRTGYAALGLSPDVGSSYFLSRRIGGIRARQLFFTNETVDATRCLELGIVDAVHEPESLQREAEALCARLVAGATGSFARIKHLCAEAGRNSLSEHLALEQRYIVERSRSADVREGVAAFLERRPAHFSA